MVAESTRGPDWELYAPHREAFTRVVLSAPRPELARLCVLGAGKCNDLDLAQLTEAFREVHLVDLEPALLASAVSREPSVVKQRLVPHAPVDLSFLNEKRASKWKKRPPSAAELRGALDAALHTLLARLPGPFDVVVSACVLTQLGFALTRSLAEPHPLLGPLRLAVARLHLRTLLGLTSGGGTSLLVTDVASSSHYPLVGLPVDADLTSVLMDVVAKRAFYHLAQPELLHDLLIDLAPERTAARLTPWLWSGPQGRTYLVYGYAAGAESSAG
ncbi:MAG: hypothetical protein K0R38_5252 [Polyangiaceae bacterium]|nr:hypothetical protein [Polyangiaceae bacterium]